MARIIYLIVFVALTTTSAYKYPFPSYSAPYESQNRASQFRRVYDSSLEQDAGTYQERSDSDQSNYRERNETRKWSSERPMERSISFGHDQQRVQENARRAPALEDVQLRNGNSSYKIMHSLPKIYPSITKRRVATDAESAVVFPGPTSGTRKMFTPQVTKECEDLGICENSPDYPHEYVEQLLAQLPDADVRFNLDVETPEISQRRGQEQPQSNPNVELCQPETKIIYPDAVRTKTGKWSYVINGKNTKVQGFRGTTCKAPGQPCSNIVFFPQDYTAFCEQKMLDRYMWVLGDNGVMQQAIVPMPSCCTCVLSKVSR